MVKGIFKSNGAFLGAFVFGVLPVVGLIGAILLDSDSFIFLLYPTVINPFMLCIIAFGNFISEIITPNTSTWLLIFILVWIFSTNLIIGFVLGWVAEILIKKDKKDEEPYYDST